MNNPSHYHDRTMSVRPSTGFEFAVPEGIPGINMMLCPVSEGTDCYWEFIDPLPDGTHQLRYVKNVPTNAKPVSTTS